MSIRLGLTLFLLWSAELAFGQATFNRSGHPGVTTSPYRFFPCGGDEILAVDFEDGQLPAGWLILDEDGLPPHDDIASEVTPGWQPRQDFQNSSNRLFISPSWYEDTVGQCDDWLITDVIQLGNNTCLSWRAYSQDPFFPESYEVRISTTDQQISSFLANDPLLSIASEDSVLSFRSVNLSDFAGQQVYIAFRHTSTDKFILALDDIRVAEVEEMDLSVFRVFQPGVEVGDTVKLRGAVINAGSDTLLLPPSSTIEINYSIDGGPTQTSRLYEDSLNFVLVPNDTIEFTHDVEAVFPVEKVYSVCMWPSNFSDQDRSNDTLCVFVGLGSFTSVDRAAPTPAIKLYPQPATERVYIEMEPSIQMRSWAIYSLQGKLIKSGEGVTRSVPVGALTPGVYQFRIETSEAWLNYKLIKQ